MRKKFKIRTPNDADKDFLATLNRGSLGTPYEDLSFMPKRSNFFKEFLNNLKPMSLRLLEITLKVLKWAAIIGGVLLGVLFLGIITKGRFFNFLLYISLLGACVFLAFVFPVLIAFKVADLYQKLDKNTERSYWIGNFIRCMGLFEGMRNARSQFRGEDYFHHRQNKFHDF